MTSSLETLTVGGAGTGAFRLGASVSLNQTQNQTAASIADHANVMAGAVNVLATDNSTIQALAGGVAGAGGAAVGAALGTNDIGDTDTAYIDDATINSGASVMVLANSTSSIESLTVGGAGTARYALGTSADLNETSNTVNADISDNSPGQCGRRRRRVGNRHADNRRPGRRRSRRRRAPPSDCLATNDIGDTDTAYLDNASVTSNTVTVSATMTSSLETLTAGGPRSRVCLGCIGGSERNQQHRGRPRLRRFPRHGNRLSSRDGERYPDGRGPCGRRSRCRRRRDRAALATNEIADTDTAYIDNATVSSCASRRGHRHFQPIARDNRHLRRRRRRLCPGWLGGLEFHHRYDRRPHHRWRDAYAAGAITVFATETPTLNGLAGAGAGAEAAPSVWLLSPTPTRAPSAPGYRSVDRDVDQRRRPGERQHPDPHGPQHRRCWRPHFSGAGSLRSDPVGRRECLHFGGFGGVGGGLHPGRAQFTDNVSNTAGAFSLGIASAGAAISNVTLDPSTTAYVTDGGVLTAVNTVGITTNADIQSTDVETIAGSLGFAVADASLATLNSANNASAFVGPVPLHRAR